MAEASDGTEGVSGNVSDQLATLVPTFDPSKDDLNVYQQKVALILEAWPPWKIHRTCYKTDSELHRLCF